MLQGERSRIRDPMMSLIFLSIYFLPAALFAGVYSASNINEYRKILLGGGGRARPALKTDSLTATCDPIV
jgi:hypothetical protein